MVNDGAPLHTLVEGRSRPSMDPVSVRVYMYVRVSKTIYLTFVARKSRGQKIANEIQGPFTALVALFALFSPLLYMLIIENNNNNNKHKSNLSHPLARYGVILFEIMHF